MPVLVVSQVKDLRKNDAGQTLYAWTPPLEGLNTIISIAAKPLADVRNNAHRCVPCICHQSLEEPEVIRFVPGALSIPRGPMFWYDNPCSDKALRFWQLASVVVDDGEEAYTISLCHQCCNVRMTAQGQAPLKSWQWKAVVEQKSASWQTVENVGKGRVYTRNVGVLPS